MKNSPLLGKLLSALPDMKHNHVPNTAGYEFLEAAAEEALKSLPLREARPEAFVFAQFGELSFPFHQMGSIDTTHLFGLDELIIYAFYLKSRNRYKCIADMGANLGLHSLLLARLGLQVQSYEPDPVHFELFSANVKQNGLQKLITPHQAAVSNEAGTMEFVRVVGNTTSSHLAGAKSAAYGELERFPVQVVSVHEIMRDVDFIKMDVEGQEAKIITAIDKAGWKTCEMMLEIGSAENAALIFDHCSRIGLSIFTQKNSWERAKTVADVPASRLEGSAFITARDNMIWG